MNGVGHFLQAFVVYKMYWLGLALILAILAYVFWVRGTETAFKKRLSIASQRFQGSTFVTLIVAFLLFAGMGSYIYYHTNILNDYTTSKGREKRRAAFEKEYKYLSKLPQPRITDVKVAVDIYPEEREMAAKGTFRLLNKTNKPVKQIVVDYFSTLDKHDFSFDREATLAIEDAKMGLLVYELQKELQPGEATIFTFDIKTSQDPVGNKDDISFVENGTFFNNSYFPSIGYNTNSELSDNDTRKEYDLLEKPRMPNQNDSVGLANTYISNDADWINFETTVSTVPDQIAIAPGYLQKEWTENGRRYFHYKMDAPILNFYAFQSGRYEVKKEDWNGVSLEIYYHPTHTYNLDRMMESMKESLAYYSKNFSPYPHKQARIIEFPYKSFAQSFPNTVPFSELIGFIADVDPDDDEDIDYPYYVTAHELAHQWWAHIVTSANVKGATVMSETMSQYSALMVMEKEYGHDRMKKFLEYEMDKYLSGRSVERKGEQPLLYNENQQYIHYNKGSVAMYALREYVGEDSLNAALSRYVDSVKYAEAPYPTSQSFAYFVKQAVPDSLAYLFDDMFDKIVLYDNRLDNPYYIKHDSNRYEVVLPLITKKEQADSIGNTTEMAMNDWIEVGIWKRTKNKAGNYEDNWLHLKKHKIKSGESTLRIFVDSKPEQAALDPNYLLIDRKPSDNKAKLKPKEEEEVVSMK